MMPKFIIYNYHIDIKIMNFKLMKKSIIYDFFHHKNTEQIQKTYLGKSFFILEKVSLSDDVLWILMRSIHLRPDKNTI